RKPRKLAAAAAALKSVSAHKVFALFLQVAEFWNIDSSTVRVSIAAAVSVPLEPRNEPRDVARHDLLTEILAQYAAGISQAVRVVVVFGVQPNAGGIERPGAHHNHFAVDFFHLAGDAVNEHNTFSPVLLVRGYLPDHRIGARCQVAGFLGDRQQHSHGTERRRDGANTSAVAAIMTRRASVESWRSDHCRTPVDHMPARKLPFDLPLEDRFRAGQRNRRKKMAVRIILQAVGMPAYADPVLNPAVVRLNIFVGNWP